MRISPFKKIFIYTLIVVQITTCWSVLADTGDFLQTLEGGFYSNAIPATAGGVVVPGSGGAIFTQDSLWVTTQTPISPVSSGGGWTGAPLPSSTGQGTSVFSQTPIVRNGITNTPVTSLTSRPSFNSAPPVPNSAVSVKNSQAQWVKSSLVKKNSIALRNQTSAISTLKAQVFLKSIGTALSPYPGIIVPVSSLQKMPILEWVVEGDPGQYIVLITTDRHDYFLRVPVDTDGKWSTQNTTTPRNIIQQFMTFGRMNLRVSLIEVGRNIPLSQTNQEIFVVTESQLSFGR